MVHFKPLCDFCKLNPATVFVTRIVHHSSSKQRLCPGCARRHASGQQWMKASAPLIGDGSVPSSIALDDVVKELFQQMKKSEASGDSLPIFQNQQGKFSSLGFVADGNGGELEGDFDDEDFDDSNPPDESDLSDDDLEGIFSEMESLLGDISDDDALSDDTGVLLPSAISSAREVVSARCPKCGTTWDRLRQDGRAGCAQCYVSFNDKLIEVMEKMQRQPHHTGKLPRAAFKRKRRLEHLRTKRDHRLEMLNRRLKEAVAAEKYEDAAMLRDKIKIVSSTIVAND